MAAFAHDLKFYTTQVKKLVFMLSCSVFMGSESIYEKYQKFTVEEVSAWLIESGFPASENKVSEICESEMKPDSPKSCFQLLKFTKEREYPAKEDIKNQRRSLSLILSFGYEYNSFIIIMILTALSAMQKVTPRANILCVKVFSCFCLCIC